MHTEKSSDEPILVGTTKAGSEWYWYPDRHRLQDMEILVKRLQHWEGVPTTEALQMIAEKPSVIIVKLTSTQADRLHELLPPAFVEKEITLLATRVKATPDALGMILGYLDDDTAIDYVLAAGYAQTDEEITFTERQVRRSMESLRQKIKSAVRLAQQTK